MTCVHYSLLGSIACGIDGFRVLFWWFLVCCYKKLVFFFFECVHLYCYYGTTLLHSLYVIGIFTILIYSLYQKNQQEKIIILQKKIQENFIDIPKTSYYNFISHNS
jgi:hypothetical protein